MPITALPTPPLRSDPANFSARADALLGALPKFVNEANSLEQSLQLVATTGTSTTSVAVGTGAKAFNTQTGKAWVVGSFVYVVSSASVANMMTGQVTAYNSATGALTVNVLVVTGSGTLASWMIGLAVPSTAAANVSGGAVGQLVYQSGANTTAFLDVGTAGQLLRSAGSGAPTWLNPEAATAAAAASGTADAITATFTPAVTSLSAGILVYVRASAANTSAAPTFKANATTAKPIIKGGNMPLVPGDIAGAGHWLELAYDATLDRWVLGNPATGVMTANKLQSVTATVASNALTVKLNPTMLDFRSSTLTSGAPNTRPVASTLTLTVPSGATLGTVAAMQARLVILAVDNAGTVELGICNLAGGIALDETGLISTTAISAAATSAGVVYSTTARTSVPYRVVGFVDITEATAGTWATAPTLVQGVGGQALAALSSHGYGQTIQNVLGSRAAGTTYYNLTGKSITVMITTTTTSTTNSTVVTVNGLAVCEFGISATNNPTTSTFEVPAGVSYSVAVVNANVTRWTEFR